MSQSADIPQQDKPTFEQELEQLQVAEANLERKTKDMWSAEVVALVVAFIALAVGVAGLVAGLSKATGGTTTVMMRSGGSAGNGGAAATTNMPGAASGMMGKRTTAGTAGGLGARTVSVTLGEMYVRPSRSTISAGKVTFVAKNVGMLEHELMIERAPIKMDGPGRPNEDAAMGMIEDMGHLGTGKMTLKLTPGTYELFCNVSGHYSAGQHTLFTVTKA
jgi:uncharacterized cupredoxin-like copper-binding protein